MKEFKGTPGKWNYSHARGEVVSKSEGLIAELVVNGREDNNGSLIAAAPDLLEALQEMTAIVKKNSYPQPDKPSSNYARAEWAESIISKALGEE